jgi:hypothetical protein
MQLESQIILHRGETRIPDFFDVIVKKVCPNPFLPMPLLLTLSNLRAFIQDTIVDDASPVVKDYISDNAQIPSSSDMKSYRMSLYAWRGSGTTNWCTDAQGA